MIRTCLLVVVIGSWLLFLHLEHNDWSRYLANSLSIASPGEPIDWRSDKLFFEGWSPAEATHRWSNSKRPMICFKVMREPEPGHSGLSITVDADAVEPLVGQSVPVQINDRTAEYRMSAEQRHVFKFENVGVMKNDMLCMRFILPVTWNAAGDPRDLGISFKDLSYQYFDN